MRMPRYATAALWVNPDGSHVRTTLAYSASSGSDSASLFLAGDVSAYNAAHADAPASEVVSSP